MLLNNVRSNYCKRVFFNAKFLDNFNFSSSFYALHFLRLEWSKILSQSEFQAAELNWRQFNTQSRRNWKVRRNWCAEVLKQLNSIGGNLMLKVAAIEKCAEIRYNHFKFAFYSFVLAIATEVRVTSFFTLIGASFMFISAIKFLVTRNLPRSQKYFLNLNLTFLYSF